MDHLHVTFETALRDVLTRTNRPQQRTCNWALRCREMFEHATGEGNRRPLPPELRRWAEYQRVRWQRNQMPETERGCLELVPGWSWAPREDRWAERLRDVQDFECQHGSLPKRNQTDRDEDRLADWLQRNATSMRRNQLPYERRVALERLFELARSRGPRGCL